MKRYLLALGLLALMVSCSRKDWKDTSLPPSERAALLLKEMTLEEKVGQMCQYVAPCYVPPGQGSPYKNIDPMRTSATRTLLTRSAGARSDLSCTALLRRKQLPSRNLHRKAD